MIAAADATLAGPNAPVPGAGRELGVARKGYLIFADGNPFARFIVQCSKRKLITQSGLSGDVAVFSNAQLSAAQISATELQDAAQRIKALRRAATEHAVEIGRELLRVKEKLPHGVFVKWVERACEFKIRTAQDLMKLARGADSDTKLVALMVPSTLRLYLSKTTPPAVRDDILKRLENGERVSRSELHSHVSRVRPQAKAEPDDLPAREREGFSSSFFAGPDIQKTAEEGRGDLGKDRARMVAELILRRLSPEDYALIMEGITWEAWNRAFVWMKAGRSAGVGQVDLALSNTSVVQALEASSAKLQ